MKSKVKMTPKETLNPQAVAKLESSLSLTNLVTQRIAELPQFELGLTIKGNLNKPVLKEVFKDDNGQTGFVVVRVLMTRFLDSFAFTTKLTPAQIDVLTVDALDYFSHESLEDLILFLKMARSGKFGATKRGVDSNLIFGEWFPQYTELKAIERETIIKKQQDEHKSFAVKMSDVEITYKKAMERKLKRQEKEYVDEFTKNFDRQMLEDTIDSWNRTEELKPFVHLLKKKRRTIKN
jgi:hypothetical protein